MLVLQDERKGCLISRVNNTHTSVVVQGYDSIDGIRHTLTLVYPPPNTPAECTTTHLHTHVDMGEGIPVQEERVGGSDALNDVHVWRGPSPLAGSRSNC